LLHLAPERGGDVLDEKARLAAADDRKDWTVSARFPLSRLT
jgi:hypothetical protein